ncbi:MAG: shikimate dehydrogenase [Brevinematales bacterium]|nr:shikimate dehydrogenase [Brevinematales bacterium]
MITSYTNLYCVIGNPIKHSKSPIIHNFIFQKLGIDAVYLAFEVRDLESFFKFVKDSGVGGVSVTIPHKVEVIKFLDEVDEIAYRVGAVNTVKNVNNRLIGYNTDIQGVIKAFETRGVFNLKDKIGLIIGNGGVARSVAWAFVEMGISHIIVAGRDNGKVESFVEGIRKYFVSIEGIVLERLPEIMDKVDIVSNCTPLGMYPNVDDTPINTSLLSSRHIIFDTVYTPEHTKLVKYGVEIGCRIVYGIDMFVFQALEQDNIWFNNPVVYSFKDAVVNLLNQFR